MDVLRALPGVTESNYHQLAAKVLCLQDLFVMPLAAMQAIIGAENGRKLHSFVNTQASVARGAFPGNLSCVLPCVMQRHAAVSRAICRRRLHCENPGLHGGCDGLLCG